MQGQCVDRLREADALGARRDLGEHDIRARQDAERREMTLADPRGMHAERLGKDRLLGDVADYWFAVRVLVL